MQQNSVRVQSPTFAGIYGQFCRLIAKVALYFQTQIVRLTESSQYKQPSVIDRLQNWKLCDHILALECFMFCVFLYEDHLNPF